jgi:hypothetical protein
MNPGGHQRMIETRHEGSERGMRKKVMMGHIARPREKKSKLFRYIKIGRI